MIVIVWLENKPGMVICCLVTVVLMVMLMVVVMVNNDVDCDHLVGEQAQDGDLLPGDGGDST